MDLSDLWIILIQDLFAIIQIKRVDIHIKINHQYLNGIYQSLLNHWYIQNNQI
jgi:hypothetical protein